MTKPTVEEMKARASVLADAAKRAAVEEKTPVKPETLKDFVRRMRNMDIDWPENTIEKLNDIDERKDS